MRQIVTNFQASLKPKAKKAPEKGIKKPATKGCGFFSMAVG